MVAWICDMCGKHTHVTPPTELVFEDEEKTKPKITHLRRQDAHGKMTKIPVQVQKDLGERTKIVRLTVGDETIQTDLCTKCVEHLRPEFDALWLKMESLKKS
jgi:hypothetical protein